MGFQGVRDMNVLLGGCRTLATAALLMLASAPPLAAGPPKALTLGGVNYPADLPTLVADRKEMFKAQALPVTVSYAASGMDNLARLRAGDIDVATMALTPLVLDYLNDADPGSADDPVILANLVHAFDLKQIVTLDPQAQPDSNWFTGKRLGLARRTNAEFFWFQFAHFHGLDPDTVELVHYPAPALPQALVNGEVDAAAMWEPWVTVTEREIGDRLRRLDHGNIYVAKWVLVTRREMVEAEPKRLRALLQAYRNAVDFIERHPDQAAELYSEISGMDAATVVAQLDAQVYDLNLDWSLVVGLQQEFDWARRAGYAAVNSEGRPLGLIAGKPLKDLFPMTVILLGSSGNTEGEPRP